MQKSISLEWRVALIAPRFRISSLLTRPTCADFHSSFRVAAYPKPLKRVAVGEAPLKRVAVQPPLQRRASNACQLASYKVGEWGPRVSASHPPQIRLAAWPMASASTGSSAMCKYIVAV